MGSSAIVNEDSYFPSRGKVYTVGSSTVGLSEIPITVTRFAECFDLTRRENGEFYVLIGEDGKGIAIYCGFSQPHPVRFSSKSVFKIADTPYNLGNFVLSVRQRHDDMIVYLRYCGTKAAILQL